MAHLLTAPPLPSLLSLPVLLSVPPSPHQEEELSEEAKRRFLEVIERRSKRVPLQYITGTQEFMGHSFLVSDQVLIPRQDTEVLVEEVLKVLKPGMRFLDLCTGSGCILLSLLLGCPGAVGVGSDISLPALKIAAAAHIFQKEPRIQSGLRNTCPLKLPLSIPAGF